MDIVVNHNYTQEYEANVTEFALPTDRRLMAVIYYGPMLILSVYDYVNGNLVQQAELDYTGSMPNPPMSYINGLTTRCTLFPNDGVVRIYRVNRAAGTDFASIKDLIEDIERARDSRSTESISIMTSGNPTDATISATLGTLTLNNLAIESQGSTAAATLQLNTAELSSSTITALTPVTVPAQTVPLTIAPVNLPVPTATYNGSTVSSSVDATVWQEILSTNWYPKTSTTPPGQTYVLSATTAVVGGTSNPALLELSVYILIPRASNSVPRTVEFYVSESTNTFGPYAMQASFVGYNNNSDLNQPFTCRIPILIQLAGGTVFTIKTSINTAGSGVYEEGLHARIISLVTPRVNVSSAGTVTVNPVSPVTVSGTTTVNAHSGSYPSNTIPILVPSTPFTKNLPVSGDFTSTTEIQLGYTDVFVTTTKRSGIEPTLQLNATIVRAGK